MVDTEREAFEAWNDSLGQESFGIRSVPNLPPAAWAAWQARAALASRPAGVDGSPVDQACARVRSAEAELKAARKALLVVMTTAAPTDE